MEEHKLGGSVGLVLEQLSDLKERKGSSRHGLSHSEMTWKLEEKDADLLRRRQKLGKRLEEHERAVFLVARQDLGGNL